MIAVLSVCALGYVSRSAAATQSSYQIGALRARQAQLLGQQEQIHYQISVASSAGRLDSDASRLGLVRSGQWQYLPGSSSPIAMARPVPPQVDPARSWMDQLAVALGRPTDAQAKGR